MMIKRIDPIRDVEISQMPISEVRTLYAELITIEKDRRIYRDNDGRSLVDVDREKLHDVQLGVEQDMMLCANRIREYYAREGAHLKYSDEE